MLKQAIQPNFYIFGSERSGSTLLCALLSQHPDIFCLNDSFIFYAWAESRGIANPNAPWKRKILSKFKRFGSEDKLITREDARCYFEKLLERYKRPNRLKQTTWLNEYAEALEISDILNEADKRKFGLRDLFDLTYAQLVPTDYCDRKCFGEKTPRHLFLAKDILKIYPNAKVILLVRNPLSNIAGIYKRHGQRDIKKSTKIYLSYHLKQFKALYTNPNHLVIRYEEILANQEAISNQIFDYLDVKTSSTSNSFDYFIKGDYIGKKIDPGRDKRLREIFNDSQKKYIKHQCKHVFEAFYPDDLEKAAV